MAEMQKCSYCAEWIPYDVERCPNCEKPLVEQELEKTAPFVESGVSDLILDFRRQVDGTDEGETTAGSDFNAEELEPPIEDSDEISFLEDELTSGGLSVFKSQDVTDFSASQEEAGFVPSRYEALDDKTVKRQISPVLIRRALIFAGSMIGLLACLVIFLVLGRPFIGSIIAAAPEPTATIALKATPTNRSIPTSNVSTQMPSTDIPAPVPDAEIECVSWEEIGEQDVGKELCVYGVVRRWFASGDIPFVAIFSEDLGTFAFIDRSTTYSQVRPGTCVTATGTVKLMRSVRPHIEVEGDLELCD
jgi:hypothetical protein